MFADPANDEEYVPHYVAYGHHFQNAGTQPGAPDFICVEHTAGVFARVEKGFDRRILRKGSHGLRLWVSAVMALLADEVVHAVILLLKLLRQSRRGSGSAAAPAFLSTPFWAQTTAIVGGASGYEHSHHGLLRKAARRSCPPPGQRHRRSIESRQVRRSRYPVEVSRWLSRLVPLPSTDRVRPRRQLCWS